MKPPDQLIAILKNIDFPNRYKKLVDQHQTAHPFVDYAAKEAKAIIQILGYEVTYNRKEDFYKVLYVGPGWHLQLNTRLKYGAVEFILDLYRENEDEHQGGNFGYLYRTMADFRLFKPLFADYRELETILKVGLSIYEDVRKELTLSVNAEMGNET